MKAFLSKPVERKRSFMRPLTFYYIQQFQLRLPVRKFAMLMEEIDAIEV
jgi:hypothetical protein